MSRVSEFISVCTVLTLVLCGMTGCNTSNGWFANNEGVSAYKQGNYTLARNAFKRAAIDDPDNTNYQYNLAMAMKKQGDMQGAEQQLRQALNQRPDHQATNHGLAELLNKQGRSAEALQLMQQWVAVEPQLPQAHVELAWQQREMGNTAGAEAALQQALRLQPNNPVAQAQLGQLYHSTGRTPQAVAMYQNSLQNNWNQPEVHSRLASLQGPMSIQRERARTAAVNSPYTVPYGTATASLPGQWQAYQPGYAPTMTTMQQVPMMQSAQMAPTPITTGSVDADPAHSGTAATINR
ncbi:cellulose synthase subunit BcsC [Polystyrenella longa]|uniref:Cellulose synthase subunit BcsC n=1 Tax=Polystyrenella longa TaxID=2528007 RepID=A0A518CHR2_9PLAN|nr:tetratricopeptide repeat protein [Polystyrenella longa]QDU78765.1 cellulose synthase subunit BcsC [Polystyrenella longa]